MEERITVYGADWCGDTVRALRHLDRSGKKYDFIDIDENKEGEGKVIAFNKGKRRIPLVEIASDNGQPTQLSVPSESEIDAALRK